LAPYRGCVDGQGRFWWRGLFGWFVRTRPMRAFLGRVNDYVDHSLAILTPEETLAFLEERLTGAIRTGGVDIGPAAKGRELVADQLEKMDRFTEARVFREATLDSSRRNRGVDDWMTLRAEIFLASNLGASGMATEAVELLQHVYSVRERTLGPEHDETKKAQRWLTWAETLPMS